MERRLVLGLGRIARVVGAPPSGGRERSRASRSRRRLASSSAVSMRASFSSVTTSPESRVSISDEARVVGVLERLEGAGEILEGRGDVVGRGFGFYNWDHDQSIGS